MEKRLIDLLLKDLSSLPDEKKKSLRTAAGNSADIVMISSAYPLDDDTQRKLEKSLAANLNVNLPVQYVHDKDLQAGLRITIGDWVLHANLQDELKSFVDIAHEK
jgi:F-type H+-transporting ATPase subunit b